MNVFDLFAKISLDTSEYEKGLSDSGGILDSFSSKFTNVLKDLSTKFFEFGKDCVSTGMDFDKAMSQVAATLGQDIESPMMQTLRDFAQEMGRKTAFTAAECSEALNYMALAGYDAQTSMEMLPVVLDLAAAGNMGLAKASDMVTDSQTALGLSIDETKIMVDQMAKAAASSNTSVEQLGDAILTVGANAKGMKGGTQELITLLGKLADNGIKGSEGGTKLRNMLSALRGNTEDASAMMESFGISLYDSSGNIRMINDVLDEFSSKMTKMTREEQDNVISTMFNARDMAAARSLIDSAATAYDDLTAKIADSNGAAAEMAGRQLDNLAGDVTLFKDAVEDVKISISDLATPYLREGVQKLTTEVGNFAGAFKANGIKGVASMFRIEMEDVRRNLIEPLIEDAPEIGRKAVDFVGKFLTAVTNPDNTKGILSAGFEILGGLIDGITDPSTIDNFLEAAPKVISNLAEGFKNFFIGEHGDGGLMGAANKIVDRIGEYLAKEENRRKVYKAAEDILTTLGNALIEMAGVLLPFIGKLAATLAKLLVDSVTDALEWVVNPEGAIADANNPYGAPTWYLEKYNQQDNAALAVEQQYQADVDYANAKENYEEAMRSDYATYADRKAAEEDLISAYAKKYGVKIPGYAEGGIVTRPTFALIGEDGPEAVVPLSKRSETADALGMSGITIQFGDIYVSGTQNTGQEVVRQIDEALRSYQLQQVRGIGGMAWQQ